MGGPRIPRIQLLENPASCPKCGIGWDFRLDELGRVVAIHSVVKCVPKAIVLSVAGRVDTSITRICVQCKEKFHPRKFSKAKQTTCSIECSNKRQRDRKREEYKRNKKAA